MRTFEYRLYPNKAQSHLLMGCLIESRKLYNEMLETVKAQYEQRGTFPGKYDLTACFKGRGGEHVPATTVQSLADRLSKSLKRFLARKELALKVVLSLASSKATNGIPSNCGNTAKMSMCMRRRNTSSCPRRSGNPSRSRCIAR